MEKLNELLISERRLSKPRITRILSTVFGNVRNENVKPAMEHIGKYWLHREEFMEGWLDENLYLTNEDLIKLVSNSLTENCEINIERVIFSMNIDGEDELFEFHKNNDDEWLKSKVNSL